MDYRRGDEEGTTVVWECIGNFLFWAAMVIGACAYVWMFFAWRSSKT